MNSGFSVSYIRRCPGSPPIREWCTKVIIFYCSGVGTTICITPLIVVWRTSSLWWSMWNLMLSCFILMSFTAVCVSRLFAYEFGGCRRRRRIYCSVRCIKRYVHYNKRTMNIADRVNRMYVCVSTARCYYC